MKQFLALISSIFILSACANIDQNVLDQDPQLTISSSIPGVSRVYEDWIIADDPKNQLVGLNYGIIDAVYQKDFDRVIGVTRSTVRAFNASNAIQIGHGARVPFATGGIFSFAESHPGARIEAVAIQADNKIVVAGTNRSFIFLARLTPDGALDPTFDGDGMAYAPGMRGTLWPDCDSTIKVRAWTSEEGGLTVEGGLVSAIAIQHLQADAKILVAGRMVDCLPGRDNDIYGAAITRFNSDGSLDTSFKQNGQILRFSEYDDGFSSIGIDRSNKIVAAGRFGSRAGLVRFVADGTMDISFGGSGVVFPLGESFSAATNFIFQESSMIVTARGVLAGSMPAVSSTMLFRVKENGELDKTFGCLGCEGINELEDNVQKIEKFPVKFCVELYLDTPCGMADAYADDTRRHHRDGGLAIDSFSHIVVAVNDPGGRLKLYYYFPNGGPFSISVVGSNIGTGITPSIASGFVWDMVLVGNDGSFSNFTDRAFIVGRTHLPLLNPCKRERPEECDDRGGYAFVYNPNAT